MLTTVAHTHTYAKTIIFPHPAVFSLHIEIQSHTRVCLPPLLKLSRLPTLSCLSPVPGGLCVRRWQWTQQPPPLRAVGEMKALGVHYKTTTAAAAAGDQPPGLQTIPPSHPSIDFSLFMFLAISLFLPSFTSFRLVLAFLSFLSPSLSLFTPSYCKAIVCNKGKY